MGRIKIHEDSDNLIYYNSDVGLGSGNILTIDQTGIKTGAPTVETKIYVDTSGSDTYGNGTKISPYATISKAMLLATATKNTILCAPGTYSEDVTWSSVNGVILAGQIPGLATIEAVTSFAVKINPAAASGTWSATLQGINLSHGDGLSGLWVNNTSVGKRINIYLNDVDIESETSTDAAIDVDRAGTSAHAIRLYANGRGNTIEGLVDYITESTDDRVRFWGYRLVGGITITGGIVMEVVFVNCGIKTSGETFGTGNVTNHFGCYYETDANPNVHTTCADDDETSQA